MNIVVDLDDVIADFVPSFVGFLNEEYKADLNVEGMRGWDIENYGNITGEEVEEASRKFANQGRYGYLPLIEGAREGMQTLARDNKVYIVTYRVKEARWITLKWLEGNSIPYRGVHFSDNQPKDGISRRLKPDLAIDDSLSHLSAIECPGLLFNRPWNEDYEVGHDRVYNWNEILEKIKSVRKNEREVNKGY